MASSSGNTKNADCIFPYNPQGWTVDDMIPESDDTAILYAYYTDAETSETCYAQAIYDPQEQICVFSRVAAQ